MQLENRDGKIVAIDADGNETQVQFGPSIIKDQLGIPTYADDANAPNETQYFNTNDGTLKYKDSSGAVHSGGSSSGGVSNPMQGDLDANGHAITNAGSLSTGEVSIGEGTPYQYVSNNHTTVTVDSNGGADYESIAAAVDDAPKRHRHVYIIDVQDGHDESVGGDGHGKIQGHSQEGFSTGNRGFGSAGENYLLQILGNRSDPSQVKIDSLSAVGCVGAEMPQIWGVQFEGAQNPDVDEPVCVNVSGCSEVFFGDCNFRNSIGGASRAIQVYRGGAHIRSTDFGADAYDNAIALKRDSHVTTTDISGTTVNEGLFFQQNGQIFQKGTWLEEGVDFKSGGTVFRDGRVALSADDDKRGIMVSLMDGAQSIPSDTWTPVEFDTIEYADLGSWSSTDANITVPEKGVYEVNFNALFSNVPSSSRVECRIAASGSNHALNTGTVGGDGAHTVDTSATLKLGRGGTIQPQVKQTSGGSLDLNFDPAAKTALYVHKL